MTKKSADARIASPQFDGLIYTVRGVRVMLDRDLAEIYGVATRVFNQAVKRNQSRFPEDFMFQLTRTEAESFRRSRSQNMTASSSANRIPSQIVTASRRNVRYLPYAFTEYGALMAANVLNSARAVQMNIFESPAVALHPLRVVRAFAKMRESLRAAPNLARKLAVLEKKLTGRLNVHEAAIVGVLQELMTILNPPPGPPSPPKPKIGFVP